MYKKELQKIEALFYSNQIVDGYKINTLLFLLFSIKIEKFCFQNKI